MKKTIFLALLTLSLLISCGDSQKSSYADGVYEGSAMGHQGEIKVSVTISNNKIEKIDVLEKADSDFSDMAVKKVIDETIKKNTIDGVNTVSGATRTTKGAIEAITVALSQAGTIGESSKEAIVKEDVTIDTDVLVIGAGGAGMSAALSAKESGLDVTLIEKMVYLGGNTVRAKGGLNAAETKYQKELGIVDSIQTFIDDTMKGGKNINDPELVAYLAKNSSDAIEWLDSMGISLKSVVSSGGASRPRMHAPEGGSDAGKYIIAGLQKQLEPKGINIYTETKATEIIMKDGKAAGVITETPNGKMTINAKAVIIATGGFSANEELYTKYKPELKGFITTGHPGGTGDGIFMAEKVGAALVDMEQIQIHPTVEQSKSELVTEGLRGRGAILINQEGKRFGDEMATRDVVSADVLAQPGSYAYIIFDNNLRKNMATVESMVALGIVTEAATYEELAKKLNIPTDAFKATMDKWNNDVKAKNDTEFGRTQAIDWTLEEAPYYAIKIAPAVHHTMGGIKINTNAEVIGTNNTAIAGLYAAGEVTGGIHGANRLGGNAIADIIIFGRQAGKNAANYIQSNK